MVVRIGWKQEWKGGGGAITDAGLLMGSSSLEDGSEM